MIDIQIRKGSTSLQRSDKRLKGTTPTRMSRYPSHLSPNITPTKSGKAAKSRARREPSGVFSLFQPQQIQQFKEAFSLIDQDRDGLVGEQDLKNTFASLGTYTLKYNL